MVKTDIEPSKSRGFLEYAPAPESVTCAHERLENYLRYRVGERAPAWGPLTLWVLAAPARERAE
jgi:hypothetical protein